MKMQSLLIKNFVAGNIIQYKDHETYKSKSFKVISDLKVITLGTQIPSEESTSDHVLEDNGLYFEKWIDLNYISSALFGIYNKRHTYSNLLMFADSFGKEVVLKGSEKFQLSLNKIVNKVAGNSIMIKRKVEKLVDQMTIENFALSTISDSEFFNDNH